MSRLSESRLFTVECKGCKPPFCTVSFIERCEQDARRKEMANAVERLDIFGGYVVSVQPDGKMELEFGICRVSAVTGELGGVFGVYRWEEIRVAVQEFMNIEFLSPVEHDGSDVIDVVPE